MAMKNLFSIELQNYNKKDILEKIKEYINHPHGFYQIVSLNPENLALAHDNKLFKQVLNASQIRLIDGIGILLAGKLLGCNLTDRLAGVDLMQEIITTSAKDSLRVMFIGGRGNLANRLAQCYNERYSTRNFYGIEAVKNIHKPSQEEEEKIFSIVAVFKPHILFAAFGSPWQELWLWKNKDKLEGVVCMGVGGAFDFLSGKVSRAPFYVRKSGLEWLYRLFIQPWRWKRQLRLIKFMLLVLKEKFVQS